MTQNYNESYQQPSYIVGIGASAGGLESLESFFDHMPPNTGLAFVIVQHLSPDFKSMMDELLGRHTKMAIQRVEHGISVERNTIYLIPPNKNMILFQNTLLLSERDSAQGLHRPIDQFFFSLGDEAQDRSIAIILSGTGSDGSRGIVRVHEMGGLVIVQDKQSAQFDGMPHSAIETGQVDIITEPSQMPHKIMTYISKQQQASTAASGATEENELSVVFNLLEDRFQIDFTKYKPNTILRRIERRITMSNSRDIKNYLLRLQSNPKELDTLYRDLLIEVTKFFRDPEAFNTLMKVAIPELVEMATPTGEIRVWVPGCATGEEAYSMAVLFQEYFNTHSIKVNLRIFATDVHQQSLNLAAQGFYKGDSLANVSAEWLNRYFTPYQDGYIIDKKLREMVTFSRHNLIENPPFTKQHLISCRNVLIYLESLIQQQVIANFHFGLITGGFLMLGASDHIGVAGKEFDTLGRWRLFRKKRDIRLDTINLKMMAQPKLMPPQQSLLGQVQPRITDEWVEGLISEYVPDGLLLNEGYDILYILGNGNQYLHPPSGPGTLNALKMLAGDLQTTIRAGLIRVVKENEEVTYYGIQTNTHNGPVTLNVTIKPLKSSLNQVSRFFVALEPLLEIEAAPNTALSETANSDSMPSDQINKLKRQLKYTKEHLRITIEEVETSNEELQAANEELTTSNEELQSINEELQSVNEELYTVNAEHQRKIDELIQLNDDLQNLQKSTQIGVIFLDAQLRIRSFTPAVAQSFSLLPQDVGRPLEHLAYNIDLSFDDLTQAARTVLARGNTVEFETKTLDGVYYLLRVLPYQTESGRVDGVVLTFIDIAVRKELEALEVARQSQQYLDVMSGLLVVLNSQGEITRINPKGAELLGYTEMELLGRNWFDTCLPSHNIAEVKSVFEQLMAGKVNQVTSYENEIVTKAGELRTIVWNNALLQDVKGRISGTISSGLDITKRKDAETALQQTTHQLRVITDNLPGRISYIDAEQRLQFANQRYELLTGLPYEQIIGRHIQDIVGVERYQWAKPYIEQVLLGEPVTFEAQGPAIPNAGFAHELVTLVPDVKDKVVQGYFALVVDITDRIRAEQALQNTTRQLQTITDNIPAWVARLGPDYHFRFVNKKYGQLANLSPVEMIGRPIWEVLDFDFFNRSKPFMDRALAGETVTFEDHFPDPYSMDSFTVQITYLPDKDNDRIKGVFSLAVDVTTLKERTHFIEAVTEADPNWIYVYSLNEQRNIYLNRDIGEELGYTIAEIQAMGDQMLPLLMHPDDWARQPDHWAQLIASQDSQVFRHEYRIRHKNGEWRWHISYETVFKRNRDGSVAEILGSAIDITNRKHVEHALQKTEQQLHLIADNVPARIAYIDADQRIGYANRQYEPLTDLPPNQMIGRPLNEVIGAERYEQEKPYIDRVLAGEAVRFEIDIPTLTPDEVDHELVTFVPEIVNGEVQGFFSLVIDITDLKSAEAKLNRLNQELHQTIRSVEEGSAGS
ncbi:MAG: PAS domain-containing protein [Anaerolineaceae bacterium]|nr:PAS domain-containing protein [Anaerolineaceae bacterium]MCB9099939.1 PAS domain-containing protein [Anaerolineales bacterium]